MSDDKELTARLRDFEKVTVGDARDAADRIEQLAVTNEALTKERDEAERRLATCEKYRDAYDEMGRIGTQAVRDLEAKLAQAVEALEAIVVDDTWGLDHDVYMMCRATLAEIQSG